MFGNRDFCDGLKTGARPWWNGQRWGASSPFGITTMPLDKALEYVASGPMFWINA